LIEEYLKGDIHLAATKKRQDEMKAMLKSQLENVEETDEKGNRWLPAGRFLMKYEKRQGKTYLDSAAAEDWAKEKGFWSEVSEVKTVLDNDALLAYMYEHRYDTELEEEYQALHVTPSPTWAFIKPTEEGYSDY